MHQISCLSTANASKNVQYSVIGQHQACYLFQLQCAIAMMKPIKSALDQIEKCGVIITIDTSLAAHIPWHTDGKAMEHS